MNPTPGLYEASEVLDRLRLRRHELEELLNVGIIAPVAGGPSGEPRYCAETIDRLAGPQQRTRLADAIWWDFDLQQPSYMPVGAPWARAIDLPFYPFDDEEQQRWTRRYYKLRDACAPGPYPDPGRLTRRRSRMEDKATKAFERKHGIERPPQSRGIDVWIRGTHIKISRAKLRDLVWSKTMIHAAADLGIKETALRDLCERYMIPMPTRGHFNWKDSRKRPTKPLLPLLPRSNRKG
ncbi:hypothetical protein [Bradyrhizobium arachidis]|uniref:Uncharacterized protein n=1 Tax=Bradyrhizobium arachidis TaxID=858423 RepID=A0AAE7NNG4_9BRAD|nr:hypothetical protein [Bradyrhizobium arachidis]QOZ69148.1 hypothetical protein WN72_24620 [Bradyrhizobium arachidis]SFV01114.1 hypothetical protein SAMN05192541_109301 [Bradyrhizobium arachidis]